MGLAVLFPMWRTARFFNKFDSANINFFYMDNQNISGADAMLRQLEAIKEYIEVDVLDVIGVESVNHFKSSFDNEGFDGNKWAARKAKVKLDKKILTGQGSGDHLADSIDYEKHGREVIMSTDKAYAQVHNEGFDGTENVAAHQRTVKGKKQTVRAHTRHMVMPKRQFMGDSPVLNQKITNKIIRDVNRIAG